MKTFILGDIHGEYEKLIEVLKKSNFDYDNDLLIQLGDVLDRGDKPFECIDELLKIKNKILLIGNHDSNFIEWVASGTDMLGGHSSNGSKITIDKWNKISIDKQYFYLSEFFNKQQYYYIDKNNNLFVHAGFDRFEDIENQPLNNLIWDREFWYELILTKSKLPTINDFNEIYIGHTPTIAYDTTNPINIGNVWNLDTGSGKGGILTIFNLDSKEYFQSI